MLLHKLQISCVHTKQWYMNYNKMEVKLISTKLMPKHQLCFYKEPPSTNKDSMVNS